SPWPEGGFSSHDGGGWSSAWIGMLEFFPAQFTEPPSLKIISLSLFFTSFRGWPWCGRLRCPWGTPRALSHTWGAQGVPEKPGHPRLHATIAGAMVARIHGLTDRFATMHECLEERQRWFFQGMHAEVLGKQGFQFTMRLWKHGFYLCHGFPIEYPTSLADADSRLFSALMEAIHHHDTKSMACVLMHHARI
ncbi:hypothetical protein GOP47_0030110, partial [Adiantum capillus-veneris]